MNKINWIFTLYSITALIIIVERLLPYTRAVLQPYNFIQIHQFFQTLIFLPITVIISFFAMKIITRDFQAFKEKGNTFFLLLFIVGVYWYGAGEGWHEVANFTLNTYCHTHHFLNDLCGELFINSLYTGNSIFFIGHILMTISLLSLAKKLPTNPFTKKELIILSINSIVYAFTWFAYAAFDLVFVGLFFSTLLMLISGFFFLKVRRKWRAYPYIIYSFIAYTLATTATFLVRIF